MLLVVDSEVNVGKENDVACSLLYFSCIYREFGDGFTLESLHLARPSKGGGMKEL